MSASSSTSSDPVECLLAQAAILETQATTLETQAATIRTLVKALRATPATDDPLLDLRQLQERYQIGRSAALNAIRSGELPAVTGSRRRVMVRASDVDRWLASRPVTPRPPRSAPAEPVETLDDWDRAIGLGGRR